MKHTAGDAKKFVSGIVQSLRNGKRQGGQFPQAERLLRKMSLAADKEHTAVLTTAVPLTPGEIREITGLLSAKLDHEVTVINAVKPTCIAGVKIEIADYVIDMTYEGTLRTAEHMLLKGNSL